MNHSFDTFIAEKYGLHEAIILNHIAYWYEHNRLNNTNFHDRNFWTYNTNKAFQAKFKYFTEWNIRKAIDNLEKHGLILTGNYNKIPFDKTKWFTLTEKGQEEVGLVKKHGWYNPEAYVNFSDGDEKFTKGDDKSSVQYQVQEPITKPNTLSCTPGVEKTKKPAAKEEKLPFDNFWQAYDKKEGRAEAEKSWNKLAAADQKKAMDYVPHYVRKTPEKKYRKNAATYLNQKVWLDYDENQSAAHPLNQIPRAKMSW